LKGKTWLTGNLTIADFKLAELVGKLLLVYWDFFTTSPGYVVFNELLKGIQGLDGVKEYVNTDEYQKRKYFGPTIEGNLAKLYASKGKHFNCSLI